MSEILDVIIFGATGFTGQYVVFEAVTVLQNLRWGVAGRNHAKLQDVLKRMGDKAETSLDHIPIVIADTNNEASLHEMAKRCTVVVNCCGPYRLYGEPVVRVCIENGAHHVDMSGEPQYMELMQLKYNALAQQKNVYVVSACGFDSIPADMGIAFIEQNFDGVVNSVETFLTTSIDGRPAGIWKLNQGTWESAIYVIGHSGELRNIRANLFRPKLDKLQPKLKQRIFMFRKERIDSVCLPFPGTDRSVVIRSQRYLHINEGKRPVQMHEYIGFGSYFAAIMFALVSVFCFVLAKFSFGRRLLLNYPRFFSLGTVYPEGPAEEAMNVRFNMTMEAHGWSLNDRPIEGDPYAHAPTKSLTARVSGQNPAYGGACVALLCAAVTILKESDKMPSTGGVLAPAAAFSKTSLISRLEKCEHGMKFEVLTT